MLFASMGFLVDMHYCQGQLKSISFLGKAKSCHDLGEGMKDCPHHKKMLEAKDSAGDSLSEKGCCSSETIYYHLDKDQKHQVENTVLANASLQNFVIAFVEVFLSSSVTQTENPIYAHYKPPLIPRDIYVLLETFLL